MFRFKFILSLFLLLNIWSQSFDQQFLVSCNFKLDEEFVLYGGIFE